MRSIHYVLILLSVLILTLDLMLEKCSSGISWELTGNSWELSGNSVGIRWEYGGNVVGVDREL